MLKLSHTVIARQRLTKFTANAAPAASPQAGQPGNSSRVLGRDRNGAGIKDNDVNGTYHHH